MRLLYLANGFPPHRWAGTEHYTASLAGAFSRRGASVEVLCVGDWERGRAYFNGSETSVQDGVEVCRLHLNWTRAPDPFGYLFDNPAVAEVVGAHLERRRPDLVHVTSCETLSASVLRVVRGKGIPLVLSLTDFWFLCPRINLLRGDGGACDGATTPWECTRCLAHAAKVYRCPRAVLPESAVATLLTAAGRWPVLNRRRGLRGMVGDMRCRKAFLKDALHWADLRLTASDFVRDVHVANGVTAEILVHAYGHDLDWLAGYAGKTPATRVRVGYVGQLVPSKGVHVLLEAWRRLPAAVSERMSLDVYGALDKVPDYGVRLTGLAEGLTNVRFRGIYDHDDSAEVYASIDVLAVPSLWADFPLVVHEAFATRTPVVATNLGGMAEAVRPGRTGLLFERGNAEDLARQLRRLVDEPDLVDRLRAGIGPVKTVQQEVDELDAMYRGLVTSRQASQPSRSQPA